MKRFLLFAIAAFTLSACNEQDDPKPVSTVNLRLVRMIQKDINGAIINDYGYTYNNADQLIGSKESPVARTTISQYVYNAAGDLVNKVETNAGDVVSTVTYNVNYLAGVPVTAGVAVNEAGKVPFTYNLKYIVQAGKVISVSSSNSETLDSVVYEKDDIIQHFSGLPGALTIDNYAYGDQRGYKDLHFKWYLGSLTGLQFTKEVKDFHSEVAGSSLTLSYNYQYNISGYPVSAAIFSGGTQIGSAEFTYEVGKNL